jgi:hypothetical protein
MSQPSASNPYRSPAAPSPTPPAKTLPAHASEDPALSNSRRESLITFAIWLAACVYSITVCFRMGYWRDAATLTYVLGFPDWVFWGVILPWSVCTGLCFWMAYFYISDDDLGEEQAEEQLSTAAEAEHA